MRILVVRIGRADDIAMSIPALNAVFKFKADFERYKDLIRLANPLNAPNTGTMLIAATVGSKVATLLSDWNPTDCYPYMESSLFKIIRADDMAKPEQGLTSINCKIVLNACKSLIN